MFFLLVSVKSTDNFNFSFNCLQVLCKATISSILENKNSFPLAPLILPFMIAILVLVNLLILSPIPDNYQKSLPYYSLLLYKVTEILLN